MATALRLPIRLRLLSVAALLAASAPAAAAGDEPAPPDPRVAVGLPAEPPPRPGGLDGGPGPDPRVAAPAPSPWSAAFQSTYVWQRKPGFDAPYSGPKSLSPEAETGYTLTATLFLGARPWSGGEIALHPEVIQSRELSHLAGLAGLSNGEAQKSGGPEAKLYRARLFLRQTFPLGEPAPAAAADAGPPSHRLVVTAGNFSFADVFDGNAFSHDPRTQFLNWSLMAAAATDYAADVRGYSVGVAAEYYAGDWVFRLGRFAQPRESNGLTLDLRLLDHHGDALEIERAHLLWGQPGKVRLLLVRNYARMGSFRDALRQGAASATAPDVADVRRDQAKYGVAVGLEQNLAPDLGLFARFSQNDGRTETYAFTEVERSLALGLSAKGTRWRRGQDALGLAFVQNELSAAHREYVEAGGAGLFIGDGRIRYRPERIAEAYYSFAAVPGFWFTLDAQRVQNPAYNADRGPVNVLGCRFHVEY